MIQKLNPKETQEETQAEKILANLDSNQQEACKYLYGPLRIFAGAGSGKTRTITHRIAYGIATGAFIDKQMLCLTFTVKAATEMKERLLKLGVKKPYVSTFHAHALSNLKWLWSRINVNPNPPEIERNLDQFIHLAVNNLIDQGLLFIRNGQLFEPESQTFDEETIKSRKDSHLSKLAVNEIMSEINWAKVSLVDPPTYLEKCQEFNHQNQLGISTELFKKIFEGYENYKNQAHKIDFNDILILNCYLLINHPELRKLVQSRFQFFTVDEYQDVSPLQDLLLSLWMGGSRNLCVVGDPNQMIYSFAGASSKYLLEFDQKFPDAKTITLDLNYRSNPPIVELANNVLLLSERIFDLKAVKKGNIQVKYQVFDTDDEELSIIVNTFLRFTAFEQQDCAILVRTNYQNQDIINKFRNEKVLVIDKTQENTNDLSTSNLDELSESDSSNNSNEQAISSDEVANVDSNRADSNLDLPKITLITAHSAKGLEFETVFIIGAHDDGFPYIRAVKSGGQAQFSNKNPHLAEERRLFYVAVTRAKTNLYISYARSKHGISDDNNYQRARKKTRFLDKVWPRSRG